MPQPYQFKTGLWWRFHDYEIRNGFIRVKEEAEGEQYDPWQDYQAARKRRQAQRPAHESLQDIAQGLSTSGARIRSRKTDDQIIAWCNSHGALGLLLHQVRQVVLTPHWDDDGISFGPQPIQRRYVWKNGWEIHKIRKSAPASLQNAPELGEIVVGVEAEDPSVVIQRNLGGTWSSPEGQFEGEWGIERLPTTWGCHFPDIPADERESFLYPDPTEEVFWRLYGEPVEAFLATAFVVHELMQSLQAPKGFEYDHLDMALRQLGFLASPVSLAPRVEETGLVRYEWVSPSLLGYLAMMLLEDKRDRRLPRQCEDCGSFFIAERQSDAYCSSKCRQRRQMAHYRKRQQRAKQLHGIGWEIEAIAKDLDAKPDVVKGWLEKQKEGRKNGQTKGKR